MRHELSVSLVVKNGAGKIRECLDRLVGLADEIIVVDTGSTDGTIDEARKFKKSARIPVIIDAVGSAFSDDDGNFDFGKAKNYGYSLATKEYAMWVDVNDMLTNPIEVRNKFDKATSKYPAVNIVMFTTITKRFNFPRLRISLRKSSTFVNPIHEYVIDSCENKKVITFRNDFINFKRKRDVSRNLRALIKWWKDGHSLRTAYYIATTYKDMGNKHLARIWYEICLAEFPYWEFEEVLIAADYVASAALTNGKFDLANELTMDMIENSPDRAEGFYYRYIYDVKMNKLDNALRCLLKLRTLPRPERSRIGINEKAYNAKDREARIEDLCTRLKYDHQNINHEAKIYDSIGDAIDATQFMTTIY